MKLLPAWNLSDGDVSQVLEDALSKEEASHGLEEVEVRKGFKRC